MSIYPFKEMIITVLKTWRCRRVAHDPASEQSLRQETAGTGTECDAC